jgi:hypothetical protein
MKRLMTNVEEKYAGDVTHLRTVVELDPDSPYDRVWQPFIERWSDDHLLLAYGHHLRGKIDMGDILCSVSRDGGESWLPSVPIFHHRIPHGGWSRLYARGRHCLGRG